MEPIKITIGDKTKEENTVTMKMVARKSLDGHIMIFDHDNVDIVVIPEEKKIVLFPKNNFNDNVYSTQDRFFNFMSQKGIIKKESVQGGSAYASMEGSYPDALNGANTVQLVMFNIGKFLEEEKPHIEMEQHIEDEFEKSLLDPDKKDSTELGEVPQKAKKGTIDPNISKRVIAYGLYE